jgi:hypothetical protein
MLWSQYKLTTIIHTEFLCKQITRIPNFANCNSNFLTLQTSEFQKKIPTGIFGIENRIGIPLTMGFAEIGTKHQNSQPRLQLDHIDQYFYIQVELKNLEEAIINFLRWIRTGLEELETN